MKNPVGRPLKFKTPEELEGRIEDYFKTCEETGKLPTITGLALALDTSRKVLVDYAQKDKYSNSIKKAKSRCEELIEEGMLRNKLNATGCIFNLKNNYGWRDKQEIEHEGGMAINLISHGHLKANEDDNDSPQLQSTSLPDADTEQSSQE